MVPKICHSTTTTSTGFGKYIIVLPFIHGIVKSALQKRFLTVLFSIHNVNNFRHLSVSLCREIFQ